jgi:hypothetical protein
MRLRPARMHGGTPMLPPRQTDTWPHELGMLLRTFVPRLGVARPADGEPADQYTSTLPVGLGLKESL